MRVLPTLTDAIIQHLRLSYPLIRRILCYLALSPSLHHISRKYDYPSRVHLNYPLPSPRQPRPPDGPIPRSIMHALPGEKYPEMGTRPNGTIHLGTTNSRIRSRKVDIDLEEIMHTLRHSVRCHPWLFSSRRTRQVLKWKYALSYQRHLRCFAWILSMLLIHPTRSSAERWTSCRLSSLI